MKPKTLLILSGGMDSTVLLHHLLALGHDVRALGINYGQRHAKELSTAYVQCRKANVPFDVAPFGGLGKLLPGSSLTDDRVDVPEGHYEQESMKATVVPNRNMIMLSIAIGVAVAHKYESVAYAAHAGDHAIYPDCREEFASIMAGAARIANWHSVELIRPFISYTKAHIVKRGAELGVDFTETWSCYKGASLHCGRCGTCIERREAFYLAGVPDPTRYAEDAPTVEELVAKGWKL